MMVMVMPMDSDEDGDADGDVLGCESSISRITSMAAAQSQLIFLAAQTGNYLLRQT